MESKVKGGRFAVLLCTVNSQFITEAYGGYFDIFVDLLREEGEVWDGYKVYAGEFPSEEAVEGYDGFVVTGSCSDADSDEPWILRLVGLLRRLHFRRKKVLGVCFGHQILGRVLGGKIGRVDKGWDIGVRKIAISSSKLMPGLQPASSFFKVIEIHRDEVRDLPPTVEVMATSEMTQIEMFRCGNHIMGIQGHPEYDLDILRHLIGRLRLRNDLIEESEAASAELRMDACDSIPDRKAWEKLCRGFLKEKESVC